MKTDYEIIDCQDVVRDGEPWKAVMVVSSKGGVTTYYFKEYEFEALDLRPGKHIRITTGDEDNEG